MTSLTLPTLYKRNKNKSIQQWTIFVETKEDDCYYWTEYGQQGGKIVTTEKTYCKGKNIGRSNETSDMHQTMAEAKSEWQSKIDKGYTEVVDDVDTAVSHKIEPTLAKKYEDHFDKYEFPVASQPKFDGLRCVITREGTFSREWRPFVTLQHLRDALQPFFDAHPNIVAFDGEVYNHDYKDDFNAIVSLVKKSKPDLAAIEMAKDKIQYHVYDYVDADKTKNFDERISFLCNYLLDKVDCIKVVDTIVINDQKGLDNHFARYLEEGYEGQMIRDFLSPYKYGRSDKLLKRKTFQDSEYKIIGFEQGVGNRAGCIILNCVTPEEKVFGSVVKGNVGYTQRLFKSGEKLIGKMATIKYQNLTPDGIPRFPVCIKLRETDGAEISI